MFNRLPCSPHRVRPSLVFSKGPVETRAVFVGDVRETRSLAWQPFLEQQLALLHPKLICTMGVFAAQTLLQTGEPLSALRNRPWAYQNIPVIPTFHPESLLFHPQNKRLVWEDMKRIASIL